MRIVPARTPAPPLSSLRAMPLSTKPPNPKLNVPSLLMSAIPAQVAGVLFNAIFLDQLDSDAMQLRQINRLIEQQPEPERMGLRPIELLVLRPSEDLGRLANHYEADLPKAFRFLTRGLGTKETRSNDMLSLVMFQTDYVRHLIELGQNDAAARRDQIAKFLGV